MLYELFELVHKLENIYHHMLDTNTVTLIACPARCQDQHIFT